MENTLTGVIAGMNVENTKPQSSEISRITKINSALIEQILQKNEGLEKETEELFVLSYSKENNQVKCENCGGELDKKYNLTWVVETEAGNSLLEKNAEGNGNRFGDKTIKCNGFYGAGNYIYLKSFGGEGYKRVSNIIECSKFVFKK